MGQEPVPNVPSMPGLVMKFRSFPTLLHAGLSVGIVSALASGARIGLARPASPSGAASELSIVDADGVRSRPIPGLIALRLLDADLAVEDLGLLRELEHRLGVSGWRLGRTLAPESRTISRLLQDERVQFATQVFATPTGELVVPTPELLVGLAQGLDEDLAQQGLRHELDELGVTAHLDALGTQGTRMRRLRTGLRSGEQALALCAALARCDSLRFAEIDVVFEGHAALVPNDTLFGLQWGLENNGQSGGTVDMDMDMSAAWDITTGDSSVLITIIDVGVQQDHPDLNLILGVDVTNQPGTGDGGPQNAFDNHGTPVAGCATAIINNMVGVSGVAPDCRSFSVRTMVTIDGLGTWNSTASWTVDALVAAQGIGSRITNNSNWYGFSSFAINTEYSASRAAGLVHFASAGNFSSIQVSYPARLSSVNAVAAIDRQGVKASFSNYGADLIFTAPGIDIETTDRTGTDGYLAGDYLQDQGTSFSSPYVAGIAALLLSQSPALTVDEVEQTLILSCLDLGTPGFDEDNGWGLPNALRSLNACGAQNVCVGALNSTGLPTLMSHEGSLSLSANDLVLTAEHALPTQPGVFFYGSLGTPIPFGDGFLCVQSGPSAIHRLRPVISSDAGGFAQYATDYTLAPMNSGPGLVQAGSTWTFQFWYRDPLAGGSGFNLSDGLSISFCP